MYNVYLIKTDIKVKANTFLNINILAEDLSDATSSASYIKYNGEELQPKTEYQWKVAVTDEDGSTWESDVNTFETSFLDTTYDLNPDYKEEGDENYEG